MPSMSDMDTGALFEKYTVDEIRDIEKKTRQDIEKKKEDLRQMVGERYRDLIEAADTITEMKKSTEKVTESILKIQSLCQNLKQTCNSVNVRSGAHIPNNNNTDIFSKSEQSQLFGSAVNLKLLMDMPEKIWSGLDSGQYLLSTRQYLLSRHVYTVVQLDSHTTHLTAHFPILTHQWNIISHFRSTILQTCRARLKDINASDQIVCECLSSVLLLEDYNLQKLFEEYLKTRLEALHEMFETDSAGVSVRQQLCHVTALIVNTVYHIHALFLSESATHTSAQTSAQRPSPSSCDQLVTLLGRVTAKDETGRILSADEVSSPAYRFMSKTVSDFRPKLKHAAVALSSNILRDSSLQFINKCQSVVQSGLSKLLSYITSIKGLATIRDEIWSLLKQDERMQSWNSVCDQVFGRSLSVWDELMRKIFVDRIKVLVQDHFASTLNLTEAQIERVLLDLAKTDDKSLQWERDVLSYVWTESVHDIPSNMAWLPVSQKSLSEGGTLTMKSYAFTPAVQSLCKGVDGKVKSLLDDVKTYLQADDSSSSSLSLAELSDQSQAPFDRYADAVDIEEFTQKTCEDCCTRLLDHLEKHLSSAKQQIGSNKDRSRDKVEIERIVLIGRLSGALCVLSSNLQLCMSSQLKSTTDMTSSQTRLAKKPLAGGRGQARLTDSSPRWKNLKEKFNSFRTAAFGVWTEYTGKEVMTQFTAQLLDTSGRALLQAYTQWDNIEIEEETEDGNRVKSTIRVPMQVSWYVQNMLYKVCEDVNRIGAQAIQGSSMASLVKLLIDGTLAAYESLLREADSKADSKTDRTALTLTQSRALQLVFDLKFLMNLMLAKDESESSKEFQTRQQKVLERLESRVDPFDLDVFYPHMHNHLLRQATRTEILYGSLVADKHSMYRSNVKPSSAAAPDQHNILPLSTNQSRFTLLPLSMHSRLTSAEPAPIIQPPKSKLISSMPSSSLSSTSSSSSVKTTLPRVNTGGSSFLEQMSTMWFSSSSNKNS